MERKYKHLPTGKKITIGGKSGDSLLKIIGKLGDSDLLLGDIIKGSDWQEVVEKDYEILSFKSSELIIDWVWRIDNEKLYSENTYPNPKKWTLEEMLLPEHKLYIYSIKRLSDGEIFTIGDKYNDGDLKNETIIEFNISSENGLLVNSNLLKNIHKVKQPLFTTEDGVDIFEGDYWWYTHTKDLGWSSIVWTCNKSSNNYQPSYGDNIKRFYSEEKCREYILMNKPCLSINDIIINKISTIHEEYSDDIISLEIYLDNLKSLVKSKL